MYKTIVNPESGRKVNITGRIGQKVLQNYYQTGGFPHWTEWLATKLDPGANPETIAKPEDNYSVELSKTSEQIKNLKKVRIYKELFGKRLNKSDKKEKDKQFLGYKQKLIGEEDSVWTYNGEYNNQKPIKIASKIKPINAKDGYTIINRISLIRSAIMTGNLDYIRYIEKDSGGINNVYEEKINWPTGTYGFSFQGRNTDLYWAILSGSYDVVRYLIQDPAGPKLSTNWIGNSKEKKYSSAKYDVYNGDWVPKGCKPTGVGECYNNAESEGGTHYLIGTARRNIPKNANETHDTVKIYMLILTKGASDLNQKIKAKGNWNKIKTAVAVSSRFKKLTAHRSPRRSNPKKSRSPRRSPSKSKK